MILANSIALINFSPSAAPTVPCLKSATKIIPTIEIPPIFAVKEIKADFKPVNFFAFSSFSSKPSKFKGFMDSISSSKVLTEFLSKIF